MIEALLILIGVVCIPTLLAIGGGWIWLDESPTLYRSTDRGE